MSDESRQQRPNAWPVIATVAAGLFTFFTWIVTHQDDFFSFLARLGVISEQAAAQQAAQRRPPPAASEQRSQSAATDSAAPPVQVPRGTVPQSDAAALAANSAGGWATQLAPTIEEARRRALAVCNDAARSGPACEPVADLISANTQGCFAIALGGGRVFWSAEPGLQQARDNALRSCRAEAGAGCTERHWVCADPFATPKYSLGGPDARP